MRKVILLALLVGVLVLTACGGDVTPTPPVPIPPRETGTPVPTATPSATLTPLPSPTPADFLVSILNRRLTRAELAAEVRKEGTLTVAGWNYAASEVMVEQFEVWVQDQFGVEVGLQYVAESAPEAYLDALAQARAAGTAPPYDVVAVDERSYREALGENAVAEMLPSDLIRDAARVEPALRDEPYGIAFQSAATIAPIFHKDAIGEWFTDWKDLADPRLRRRITLPAPGDIVAGGFLMGLAGSLGKDYKNSDAMRETIEFVCTQLQPNVWKYTSDLAESQALLRENRIDAAVNWNLLARLEGFSGAEGTGDVTFRPMESGQPALNGYAWIPKGAAHPVLAQLFVGWRLSNAGQLPDAGWDISKTAWGEYHEGLLGVDYAAAIPDWVKPTYFEYYPTVADLQTRYKPVDWDYYMAHEAEWMDAYDRCAKGS